MKLFTCLQYGIAAILGLAGARTVAEEALHAHHIEMVFSKQTLTFTSLGVILGILALSVLASTVFKGDDQTHHLPESPLGGNSAQ